MVRNIVMILLLTGCASVPKVETKTVMVPTLFCPAPPPNARPNLPIYSIGPDDDIGSAVVKYKASIRALVDYANRQEEIIEMYKVLSDTSKALEKPKTIEIKEVK